MKVAIVDSGGANIGSVVYALERLGCEAALTDDAELIESAERVILPGVGAAAAAMAHLAKNGLDRVIPTLSQPVLGICLGLQLLYDHSEEGNVVCLGVFQGTARKLPEQTGCRVPHMGWNQLSLRRDSPLLEGITDGDWAYFVHSYALPVDDALTVAASEHGTEFTAIAGRGNFHAAQFHPERSAATGARLLENFLAIE
ncbi:MAG: imidazole glycerol phosphate synthase subunit HisH [Xanthomonadales bacterium]|nr:imidazole glycerol phosphate synthase subunit HisH [Xanthomonadales bacterium]